MTASILLFVACVQPPDDSVYGTQDDLDTSLDVGDSEDSQVDDSTDTESELPEPALEIDTDWLDFGEVTTGEQVISTVTLTNVGHDPVEVQDVTVPSGPWAGPKALPWTLYAGDSQDFKISYEPDEAGEHGGVVEFLTDHPEVPTYQVEVAGTAITPCEICAPVLQAGALVDFWSLLGWTDEQDLTLENIGDEPLTIYEVSVANDSVGGDFWVDFDHEMVLQPGEIGSVTVGYQSDVTALDYSTLTIQSNDPEQPTLQIGVTGLGAT